MTHLSIQWGWVGGGGGKSQETSEVQKRVGQQQQQPRISEEKLLSTAAAEQSRVLCIVSFSFCVHPPQQLQSPSKDISLASIFKQFLGGGSSSRDIILVSLFRLCCIHIHAVTILVLFPILY
jgi:hypothetical protein